MGFLLNLLVGAVTDRLLLKLGLDTLLQNKTLLKIVKTLRLNPQAIIEGQTNKFLKQLKPQQLKDLQQQLNSLVRHHEVKRALLQHIDKTMPGGTSIKSLTGKTIESLSKKELDKLELQSSLSSSWLAYGIFIPVQKNVLGQWNGVLRLTVSTGKGKSYNYFNVPYETWVGMREALGSFGSGAGSVFWRRYLHLYKSKHYRPVAKAKAFNKVRKQKGIIKYNSKKRKVTITRKKK